jgi:tellurium resistance protein TerZ
MGLTLVKGQKISLSKEAGGQLQHIHVGAGWDPANESDEIDLDLSCLMISENSEVVDMVYSNLLPGGSLRSRDGSMQHSGDNLTGDGDGDDESVTVDLSKVAADIKSIYFTLGSFSGQPFSTIANAFCRVVNKDNGTEMARFEVSEGGSHKGLVIAKIYRHNGEWKMAAIGEYNAYGKTAKDFIDIVKRI